MVCVLGKYLPKLMYKLGYFVGKWPSYFIIVPFFLCLLSATGLQNIKYSKNFDYLYLTSETESILAKSHLEHYFKMNYSFNFNKDKLINESKFGKIILVAKDNGSLFREQIFWEIVLIDRIIRNLTIDFNDLQLTYDDICAKTKNQCFNNNNVLDLAYHIKEIESNKTKITYPIWLNEDTNITYHLNNQIGGLDLSDDKFVKNVRAIKLIYYLDLSSKYGHNLAELWERKFISVLNALNNQFDHLSFSQYASFTTSEELESNLNLILNKFYLAFSFLIVYGFINCLMLDCVRSKPWIGLLMSLIPVLSILSSFGILTVLGLNMITLNWLILLTLTGINMQDSFVIISVWRITSFNSSVHKRLAETYSIAMSSITTNTFINCSFFLIGFFITNIKSIQTFCIYMSLSVFVIYSVQITLFGGLIALFGYVERRNLHSLICVPVIAKSISGQRNCFFKLFCTGGINYVDSKNYLDNKPHFIMTIYRNSFSGLINSKTTKMLISFLFFSHFILATNMVWHLKENSDQKSIFDNDSYASKYIDYDKKFFNDYKYAIQIVFNQTLDYSDSLEQNRIIQILNKIEKSKFISKNNLNECWIKSFLFDLKIIKQSFNSSININNKVNFHKILKEQFLNKQKNYKFKSDIKFNGNKIVSSRCIYFSNNLNDTENEKQMIEELKGIKKSSKVNIFFYSEKFKLFEQFSELHKSSINFFFLHLIVIIFNGITFIPTLKNMFWFILIALSVQFGLISYLVVWKIDLDLILMFTFLSVAVFNINFITHFCSIYKYLDKYKKYQEAKELFITLGFPLTQSYFLKIISFLILFLTSNFSSLLLVFAKTIFLSANLELFHNLILLPILLSLSDCSKESKNLQSTLNLDDNISFNNNSLKKSNKKHKHSFDNSQYFNEQSPFNYTEKWFDGKNLTINQCSKTPFSSLLTKQPRTNTKNNYFINYNWDILNTNNLNSRKVSFEKINNSINQNSISFLSDDQFKNDVINKFNQHWKNCNNDFILNNIKTINKNVICDKKNFSFARKASKKL